MTLKRALFALLVIALGLGAALGVAVARLGPTLRSEVVRALEARMDATVTLDTLNVRIWPIPAVTGAGLTVRHRSRPDLPPLVAIRQFSGTASWWGIFDADLRSLIVDGLEITIPPRRKDDMPAVRSAEEPASGRRDNPREFAIGTLTATNARLTILPRNPEKDPKVFDIFSLEVTDLTLLTPSQFTASLTNPVPAGRIETNGRFGPWDASEPSNTPVEGEFLFDADLGTIKGIGGALHATGTFEGPADRIAVSGKTETPDFVLPKLQATALPLTTTFHAVVDGTNGDVQLDPVDARLGQSRFIARGFVVGTKGVKGKRVLLDVVSEGARMEDILALTVRSSPPPMSGDVSITTSFDLPQGDRDVVEKLRLAGRVTIDQARFASDTVQNKVDALSRRARGRPEDLAIADVQSAIRAEFSLADGVVALKNLAYEVDGASITLRGRYALESGALDLAGTARLQASVSQTQTGFKHFVLKPFDGLFRKGKSGSRLAFKVAGTVEQPKFGLDIGRTFKGQ